MPIDPRPEATRKPPTRAGRARQDARDWLKASMSSRTRRRVLALRQGIRQHSASFRDIPDAIIIGAQRCGTSSLYRYLGMHPDVTPSLRKETDYLSFEYHRGELWYRAHFPLKTRRRSRELLGRPYVTFEATPDYLLDPRAPERAANLVPEARIIVLLRDPVGRAVSHYRHNVRLGFEDQPIEVALRLEEERLEGELERMFKDPAYRALAFRRYSYMMRGQYRDQLDRWLHFYPRDHILALSSRELFHDPVTTFTRITDFLGLPPWWPPEFRNYSYLAGGRAGSEQADRISATRRLAGVFDVSNRWVEEELGLALA